MTCIKCGRQIADGELFCEECSRGSSAQPQKAKQTHPEVYPAKPKQAGTSSAAKKGGARLAPKSERTAKKKKSGTSGTTKALAILLVVVSLIAIAAVAWIVTSRHDLTKEKNNLRAREADLQLREEEAAQTLQQSEVLREQLESANSQNAALSAQVEELQETINGNENALYQSEYDLTTQQEQLDAMTEENSQMAAEIQRLESENASFASQIQALQTEIASRQTAMDALTSERNAYKEKADFMDAHVVFVENNGTNRYHTYACEEFLKKSYWCYSKKLAESLGYTACPICGG